LPCNLHKDGRFSSFPEQTAKPKSLHGKGKCTVFDLAYLV
jgi:hypothetical protein